MKTAKEISQGLRQKLKAAKQLRAWVGCDGTVDKIVAAVDKRHGTGEQYTPVRTITQWGQRITAAAGRSTNIELFLKQEKIGGNAAIMAGALTRAGARVQLVADLGQPKLHKVFGGLAQKAKLVSLGEPTETHAVEFADGKIMLGYTRNHEAITCESLEKALGGRVGLRKSVEAAQLVALVNWTMTPGMTRIFRSWLKHVVPQMHGERVYFFDLADPQKRSAKELREALQLIGKFSPWGKAVLGVNLKEAEQVAAALGLKELKDSPAGLRSAAEAIRKRLKLGAVVIHTVKAAAAADDKEAVWIAGPYVKNPVLTTGAGDHFNAGFALAVAAKGTIEEALALGVAFSGGYVATGKSPRLQDALALIAKGW